MKRWLLKAYCRYVKKAHAVDFSKYESWADGQRACAICGEPIASLEYFYFKKGRSLYNV